VRYEFDEGIRETPCTEGNGFPGMGTECEGVFVKHFTTDKTLLRAGVEQALSPRLMEMLYADLVRSLKKEG